MLILQPFNWLCIFGLLREKDTLPVFKHEASKLMPLGS